MYNKLLQSFVFFGIQKERLKIQNPLHLSQNLFIVCAVTLCIAFNAIAAPTPYEFNVTQLGDSTEEVSAILVESQNMTHDNSEQISSDAIHVTHDFSSEFTSQLSETALKEPSHEPNGGGLGAISKKFSFNDYANENFSFSDFAGDFMLALNSESESDARSDRKNYQDDEKITQEQNKSVSPEKAPHILVVAGIQGDEPGGFSAASLLATRYSISYGTVTIVPNLNFLAIINRKRGVYGDMNRKFAALDKDDPEYEIVQRIKEMIVTPSIDLILNLHDGSGFYNPKYISDIQNPNRWGNSIIIDQEDFDAPRYGELEKIASEVAKGVNTNLLKDLHAIHIHNTKTADGNEEMAKSLTWFALGKGKPAFGVEASKNLNVAERTFYHLSMLENFFDYVGIKYDRPFELSPAGIQKALSTDIFIGFEQNRLVLPLNNIRRNQAGSIPLSKESCCLSNSPIITAVTNKNEITVHYGNNYLTSFKIDWHEVDTSTERMFVNIDGTEAEVPFGTVVFAQDYFLVQPKQGLRVNAIGAVVGNGPRGDESGVKIRKKDFQERFSIDKSGTTFRVEVYSADKYVGTFVVQYTQNSGDTVTAPLGQ